MIPLGTAADFAIGIEQEDGLVRGLIVSISVEGFCVRRDEAVQKYMEDQFRIRNQQLDLIAMPPPPPRLKNNPNNREHSPLRVVPQRLVRQETGYLSFDSN